MPSCLTRSKCLRGRGHSRMANGEKLTSVAVKGATPRLPPVPPRYPSSLPYDSRLVSFQLNRDRARNNQAARIDNAFVGSHQRVRVRILRLLLRVNWD